MALLLKYWRHSLIGALALFTVFTLTGDRRGRRVAVILDSRDVRALCGSEGFSETEFYERAKTMGAAGVLLRPEKLGRYLRTGAVLRFTREEIEKLRATGVASPAAPLEPGSLWVRSEALFERIRASVRAEGEKPIYGRHGAMHVVRLPRGLQAEDLPVGFAPFLGGRLAELGLLPVYLIRDGADLNAPGRIFRRGAYLIGRGFEPRSPESLAALSRALAQRRGWMFFADAEGGIGRVSRRLRRSLLAGIAAPWSRIGTAGEVSLSGGLAAVLGSAAGNGNEMIVIRLDHGRSIEGNLGDLRFLLKGLRRGGYAPNPPDELQETRRLADAEWLLRLALGFLLTVFGPILALRVGVAVLRRLYSGGKLPEASPFREVLSAAAATAATGAAVGICVYALLAAARWRLDASALRWGPWAAAVTFLLSALALYAPEFKDLRIIFRRRFAPASGLRVALPMFAAAMLLFPPEWLKAYGPAVWLGVLASWRPGWWWAASRWREWLVGYPCLLMGLYIFFMRLKAGRSYHSPVREAGNDPRAWLLLAMFAPVGLADTLAASLIPFQAVLAHTAQGAAAGLLLGLLLVAGLEGVSLP